MERQPQAPDDESVEILLLSKAHENFKRINQTVLSVLNGFTMKILFLKLFLLSFWGSREGG